MATSWGSAWCAYDQLLSKENDPEFYAEARRRREEAVARGDEPYEDFKNLVDFHGSSPRLERAWKRMMEDGDREEAAERERANEHESRLRDSSPASSESGSDSIQRHQPRRQFLEVNKSLFADDASSSKSSSKRGIFRRLFSRRKHASVDCM